MNRLKNWLKTVLANKDQRYARHIVVALLIIAIIGFADATHLTIAHYTGAELQCGEKGGCNIVTTSKYSMILGVPVALLGALYYVSIIMLCVAYLDSKKQQILYILSWYSIAGLLASLWFVYLQLFVIHAICRYCMGSAATSTLLFIGSQMLRKIVR